MKNKLASILSRDNSVVLFGNLLASGFGLLTFMILARQLSLNEFGQWTFFISIAGLFDLMKTGLIRQALVRSLSTEDNEGARDKIIGSSALLAIATHIILTILLLFLYFLSEVGLGQHSFSFFLKWYPWLLLVSLPASLDTWLSHAFGQFLRMNFLRAGLNSLFLLYIGLGALYDFNLPNLLFGYILTHGIVSGISFIHRRKVFFLVIKADRSIIKKLFWYGKHSVATLTGANLLRSIDHILIGSFMGPSFLAIYAIPMKLIDLIEIPLRGFLMTSFPRLSKWFVNKNIIEFSRHLHGKMGFLLLIILPFGGLVMLFPEFFMILLGGSQYVMHADLLRFFVPIFLIIPIDKYLGISLDSINMPKINAIKVWVMVTVNFVGDVVVIYFIGELWAVVAVTFINILVGILFAYKKLFFVEVTFSLLFQDGWKEILNLYRLIKN